SRACGKREIRIGMLAGEREGSVEESQCVCWPPKLRKSFAQGGQSLHLLCDVVVRLGSDKGRAHLLKRGECLPVQEGDAPELPACASFPAAVANTACEPFHLTPCLLSGGEVILEFNVALHGQNLEAQILIIARCLRCKQPVQFSGCGR